tara:strand:- start:582 stop:1595 length:1014 start_codon:yes stop_codon:yes gene_type:complete
MKCNISLKKTKSIVVLAIIFIILSACSSKSSSTLIPTKLLSTQAINEKAAQVLTASSEEIEKTKIVDTNSAAWIIEQYTEKAVFPEFHSKIGVRLELLKGQMSIGAIRNQVSGIDFTKKLYYSDSRKEAYRVELGNSDGKLSAYWLFEKIGDQWLWTDLIQETPYTPWLQFKSSFDPTDKLTSQMVFSDSELPGHALYQVVRRGDGAVSDLHQYIESRRYSYLEMVQALLAKNQYSAFLFNDSIIKPDRFLKWKDTGLYAWMKLEKIERVQIEGIGMILFFYASRPNLEQGVMYCHDFEACEKLGPNIAGYYFIHYQKDSVDPKVQWVHFRGANSDK